MSLAFNQSWPAVDGNVERVFARLHDLEGPVKSRVNRDFIHDEIRAMMPENRAREFNQALMELGALICRPNNPECVRCPCPPSCRSLRKGTMHERPVRPKPAPATPLQVSAGILLHQGRVFIQKRPATGLMANLWEFPGGKIKTGETPQEALMREFQEELTLSVAVGESIMVIRHGYTSFKVTLHTFWCHLSPPDQSPLLRFAVDGRWVLPGDIQNYPFPSADKKLIAHLASQEAWLEMSNSKYGMR